MTGPCSKKKCDHRGHIGGDGERCVCCGYASVRIGYYGIHPLKPQCAGCWADPSNKIAECKHGKVVV